MLIAMLRVPAFLTASLLALATGPALAQPAAAPDAAVVTAPPAPAPAPVVARPSPVVMTPLAAPDAFSTEGRSTGLPATLWTGSSLAVVKTVLPLLAHKRLSPAAAALARRVLATGAPGPAGVGNDPEVIALRAAALSTQGDPRAAAAILAHAPGWDRSPELAQAAAESALLAGQDSRACEIESGLTSGRDGIYWVRLRSYCQALAGKTAEAQLTFDLAQSQAKDVTYGRLMAAKLAGAGNPGAASQRNGLDYALSRNLGLDLSAAKPPPGGDADPGDAVIDPATIAPDLATAAQAIAGRGPVPKAELARLLDAAEAGDAKTRNRAAAAAFLVAPFVGGMDQDLEARFATLPLREGAAPLGRNLLLEGAAYGRPGETAMLALWTCAEAGPTGLAPGDRIRIVAALHAVHLDTDARAFALEGLAGLK